MSHNVKVSNTGRNPRRVRSEEGQNVLIPPGETREVNLSDGEFEAYTREQGKDTLRLGSGDTNELKEVRDRIRADTKKDNAERVREEKNEMREEKNEHREKARRRE